MIYFDSAATTPIDLKVSNFMVDILNNVYGNPSSIHKAGQKSKAVIENSRRQIASCLNASSGEIYFTGGGTESDNLVLKGLLIKGDHFITSSIEHPAILKPANELEKLGTQISIIDPNKYGEIKLKDIIPKIKPNTKLVSIMYVNNELGTINEIKKISNYLSTNNILFHTDAVQAVGKININIKEIGCDFLSASAHKFHGPKGVGFLYIKEGLTLNPQITGGGQEKNLRAGTENIAGIAGMGLAIDISNQQIEDNHNYILKLEKQLFSELEKNQIEYRRNGINQVTGLCNITLFNVPGQSLIVNLDLEGIAISFGAACASGSSKPSSIHNKIGIPLHEAECTIRISISRMNTSDEITKLTTTLSKIIPRIKRKINE
jgi:cysteine desulfurase